MASSLLSVCTVLTFDSARGALPPRPCPAPSSSVSFSLQLSYVIMILEDMRILYDSFPQLPLVNFFQNVILLGSLDNRAH